MNCLLYLYHDDKLRTEYSPNQYKKIISKRNDIIWALCRTYFEHVFKYDKTNRKTITITEPVSSSTKNKTSKFSEKKLMHQITLVLFCGNSQQMSDEYLDIQDLHHYTHYMKHKESLSYEVLNDRLRSLSETYESSGLTRASVVVLDLDDTLIDDSIRSRSRQLIDQLNEFKRIFNYVVLWSHGTSEHVRDSLRTVKIPENFFDVTITRPTLQSCGSNKGIGIVMAELYTRYQVRELTFSCIVDDLPSNFTDDYMLYVNVPGKSKVEDLTQFYTWALKEITKIKDYCESHDGNSYISTLNW
ncbi:GSCOCT00014130001.2-RA-CDS [Cotesia congregata]|uniref:Cc_38K n=1 Tax=Cotesia congregata TaxID=51543 RepID=B9W486_COTCN|nr:GSCOCT00014130001.2-RA-CDS [Cotesia congregata]CAG5089969.1 Cc_38K [Cotesia congregata]CAR31574.1 putative 38K protein [Cotesia congregata]CAR82239.1 hypothetical protein [Cotesia congregata]